MRMRRVMAPPCPLSLLPPPPCTCSSSRLASCSPNSSVMRKQWGWMQAELYFMCSVMGRRVLVPPPTWLNWNPISASTSAAAGRRVLAARGSSRAARGRRLGGGRGGGRGASAGGDRGGCRPRRCPARAQTPPPAPPLGPSLGGSLT